MELNYKFNIKDGMFKYDCDECGSYIKIKNKDAEKIYNILDRIDDIEKLAEKNEIKRYSYKRFVIIFGFDGTFAIENLSNWLNIKEEVPIIKRELIKYIKKYVKDNVKDIIIKIKSLNKGSSNIIKEDLK